MIEARMEAEEYWHLHWSGLQNHTDLRSHKFAHSPSLWHQPRIPITTCTGNWRFCGISPVTPNWSTDLYSHSCSITTFPHATLANNHKQNSCLRDYALSWLKHPAFCGTQSLHAAFLSALPIVTVLRVSSTARSIYPHLPSDREAFSIHKPKTCCYTRIAVARNSLAPCFIKPTT
jgi:hypothetical protein